jgi:methylmalonyl-CoA epimerase
MVKKIDHIGIAVQSIEKARKFYEEVLGLAFEKIDTVASQKVKVAFFAIGDIHIELLEATGPDSPIAKFIEKNGEGIHHIAYACDNIEQQLDQAKQAGVKLINAEPVPGAGDKKVAFLHPKSSFGVLTEFCSWPR